MVTAIAGAPRCHSISKAPSASTLANSMAERSSVTTLPLPRKPPLLQLARSIAYVARMADWQSFISADSMRANGSLDSKNNQGREIFSPMVSLIVAARLSLR